LKEDKEMKVAYTSVRPLRWANIELTAIDCVVKFDHVKNEVPFTASKFDVEEHGREIFRRWEAGEFGTVGDPSPQPAVSVASSLPLASIGTVGHNCLVFSEKLTKKYREEPIEASSLYGRVGSRNY
jgi:hypothetical protein